MCVSFDTGWSLCEIKKGVFVILDQITLICGANPLKEFNNTSFETSFVLIYTMSTHYRQTYEENNNDIKVLVNR